MTCFYAYDNHMITYMITLNFSDEKEITNTVRVQQKTIEPYFIRMKINVE